MHRLLLLAGLLALPLVTAAQTTFTELAVADTLFDTPPETDFWVASVAPADADADGDLDLLVLGYHVIYFQSVEELLILYRNDGPDGDSAWAFTPIPVPFELSSSDSDLAWADYDLDGDPDVVVAAQGGTVLYRNDTVGGDVALTPTSTVLPDYVEDSDFSTIDLRSVTWADYDNDADPDLLLPSVPDDSGFGYGPTRLLRNDGPGAGDAWLFTDTEAALDTTSNAVSVWGDMDRDEDLDLLLANVTVFEPGNDLSLFRNDAGTLVRDTTGIVHIRYGSADWNDADGDGDLDVVYAGNLDRPDGTGETVVRILLNQGEGLPYDSLTVVETGDPVDEVYAWLDFNAVTWADYDADGDVDLLVAGEVVGNGEIVGQSVVYTNEGGAVFTVGALLPAPIAGEAGGAFTWLDLDNDGDLDHFVAGAYFVPGGNGLVESRAQLFRNDAGAGFAVGAHARGGVNAPPSAPGALQATVVGGEAHLDWAPSMDDTTPEASLTYELRVRPLGAPSPSPRPLPEAGNVSLNTEWLLRGLPAGTYSWEVQALDNAFAAGPPAEGTFTVGAGAPVAVALEPVDGPVVIPAEGGAFFFSLTVSNAGPETETVEVWVEAALPSGHLLSRGPVTVTLDAGESLTRPLKQRVPARAPAGTYTYTAFVGAYPDGAVASDAFTFEKAAAQGVARGQASVRQASRDDEWGLTYAESGQPVRPGDVWTASGPSALAAASAQGALPTTFALHAARPNPFGGATTLGYDLPASSRVRLVVYDVLGREVALLLDEEQPAGRHEAVLDGSRLPSGAYLVRLEAGGAVRTQRVTLVR